MSRTGEVASARAFLVAQIALAAIGTGLWTGSLLLPFSGAGCGTVSFDVPGWFFLGVGWEMAHSEMSHGEAWRGFTLLIVLLGNLTVLLAPLPQKYRKAALPLAAAGGVAVVAGIVHVATNVPARDFASGALLWTMAVAAFAARALLLHMRQRGAKSPAEADTKETP